LSSEELRGLDAAHYLEASTIVSKTKQSVVLQLVRSANRGTELFRKEVLELCARKNRGLAVKDAAMSIRNSDFRQQDFLSQGFQSFSVSIYTQVSQKHRISKKKAKKHRKEEEGVGEEGEGEEASLPVAHKSRLAPSK
jgi:hypothetical protein